MFGAVRRMAAAMAILSVAGCSLLDMSTNPDDDNPGTGYSGTISTPTVWNKTSETYHITGSLTITSTLTWSRKTRILVDQSARIIVKDGGSLIIEEGVAASFGTGCYITVGDGSAATFIATGSDSLPILLTASTGVSRWGYGTGANYSGAIWIGPDATSSTSLRHVVIQNATSGIYVEGGYYSIMNCKIINSQFYGIFFANESGPKDSANFTGDTITGCGEYPICIAASAVGRLSGVGNYAGNTKNGIEVKAADIDEDAVWKKHTVPYVVVGTPRVGSASGATLTIRPGAVLKFDKGIYLSIGERYSATLIANGTVQDSIFFTTLTAGTNWGYGTAATYSGGIWIDEYASNLTSLKFCSISNATSGVNVTTATVTISNCSIRNNQFAGVVFSEDGSPIDSAAFVGNSITGNADYAIRISANQVGKLSGTGTIAGNTAGGISVKGDDVSDDAIWKKHDASYFIESAIRIQSDQGATVTIRPGCQFLFAQTAYLSVAERSSGALIAEGTATDSIRFEGKVAGVKWGYGSSANYSGGLWIDSYAATTTSLKMCVITNATTGAYVNQTGISIKNCRIGESKFHGIFIDGGGDQANISNNVFLPANGISPDIGVAK